MTMPFIFVIKRIDLECVLKKERTNSNKENRNMHFVSSLTQTMSQSWRTQHSLLAKSVFMTKLVHMLLKSSEQIISKTIKQV